MIQSDEQLRGTQEALAQLEAALAALTRKKATVHPERFALMTEPITAHIRQLRAEIDAYTGLAALPADYPAATEPARQD